MQTKARILLVDDNEQGLLARKTVLDELGYDVVAVSNPARALEIFSKTEFEIVVTDFKMPGMNGPELLSEIRKSRPDVPAILLSGFVDALGLNESNTGADVVIPKTNLEITHLVRSVSRLVRRKLPRKPVASDRSSHAPRRKTAL